MVDLSNLNNGNNEGPVPVETFFVVYKTAEQGWTAEGRVEEIVPRLMAARQANLLDFMHGCAQVQIDVQSHRTAQAVTGMMTAMAQQVAHSQSAANVAAAMEAQKMRPPTG